VIGYWVMGDGLLCCLLVLLRGCQRLLVVGCWLLAVVGLGGGWW
jgi:hypothetical protein